MKRFNLIIVSAFLFVAASMSSCKKNENDTGWEFAPNMYLPVGYEPLSQVKANPINADGKNMREPVAGTVSRRNYQTVFDSSARDLMIYNIGKDDIALAEEILENPVPNNPKTLKEGEVLYGRYCMHCHGEAGEGNGLVAEQYKGVPNYKADAYLNMNDGHIFHVITHGKGRMWSHASQVTPEERWKIVHYVHKLQEG
jgi:Cytochrome C oxidase, cbb3-type, subunit III